MKLRLVFLIGAAIPLAATSSAQPVVPPSPTFFPKFHAFVRFAEMVPNDGEGPVETEAWNKAFREAIPDTASDMLRICLYVAYLRFGTTSVTAIRPRAPLGFERSETYEMATYLLAKGFQLSRAEGPANINDRGLSYILETCFTPALKVKPQGISGYGTRGYGGQGLRYITMFSGDLVRSHEHLIKDFDRIYGGPEDSATAELVLFLGEDFPGRWYPSQREGPPSVAGGFYLSLADRPAILGHMADPTKQRPAATHGS